VLEKRGPTTTHSDAEFLEEIRTILEASSFLSEGHRKVWAMLRRKGIRVGRNRALRLMRENRLLALVRRVHQRGDRTHSGTVCTERPDELWGTDGCAFIRSVRAGAGSLQPLTTAPLRSWDTTSPRRETAGRRSSRSARVYVGTLEPTAPR